MKLEEQCTTTEQSRRLLELGFSKDTASLKWWLASRLEKDNEDFITASMVGIDFIPAMPCWTVADMMAILRNSQDVYISIDIGCGHVLTENKEGDYRDFMADSLRDNLFDCLVWLK